MTINLSYIILLEVTPLFSSYLRFNDTITTIRFSFEGLLVRFDIFQTSQENSRERERKWRREVVDKWEGERNE